MKILIADKDPSTLALISTRLTARNYEVLEATDSESLLRLLDRESVDLILLSTAMERIGGKLLIEKIRERPTLVTVPVIMMSEENEIAELVLSQQKGFDDFLVKPFDPLTMQLRIAMNISKTREKVEANALTHLPGNHSIEKAVKEKIERGEKFSVLYIDINQFKSFNDLAGFEKGDEVIKQTSKILLETAEARLPEGQYFIGHVGGDDFVVLLTPDYEESYAQAFIAEFDRIIPTYYNDADRKRGFVRLTNRRGKRETFPLMSCSVAACNNLHRSYRSLGEIAQDVAELKSFLKSQPGSHYLRDRRSNPIRGIEEAAAIFSEREEKKVSAEKVDPLGQILLDAGLIDYEQLTAALKKHFETGQRLGQVLIAMNAVRSDEVGRMLEKKLNVPYVSLKNLHLPREVTRLFTAQFVKSHRVVPLEIAGGTLKLGMCDPFDLKTLDAIERITGLKPIPCLALEDEFESFLETHLEPLGESREEKIG